MQLQFNLPEIDRDRTKEAVEQALETYRLYSLQVSLDRLPSITACYSFTPPSPRLPSSSTEQAAIANIDYEQARLKYINWIANAVNRLSKTERIIIYKRYLQDTEMFDYQIYAELNMSERNYYRLKARLFYKLAFALKIEVLKEAVGR
ncbi:ArpU family phage packaging/lysis transcriptional regulator [Sporosarcina newyorkensis]|uniref:Phage transcriptional regulator, ArpU family n=1 Tax=Sporosarcina newyorkensis TaxID=759851 RepID=A0A1T4YTN6_9BACL|nr:ArpU family phage packaging/lysis transcriptional regulator [Sporosarcina newyorkensis]SKB05159.1 phage transcriptional regulator, ArpU family [Sporosarcina newyorkensis]